MFSSFIVFVIHHPYTNLLFIIDQSAAYWAAVTHSAGTFYPSQETVIVKYMPAL